MRLLLGSGHRPVAPPLMSHRCLARSLTLFCYIKGVRPLAGADARSTPTMSLRTALRLFLGHAVLVDESQKPSLAYARLEGAEDVAKGAGWDGIRAGGHHGYQGSVANMLCKG